MASVSVHTARYKNSFYKLLEFILIYYKWKTLRLNTFDEYPHYHLCKYSKQVEISCNTS